MSVVITYRDGPPSFSTARLTRHGAPKDYSKHYEVGTEDYNLFGTSDTFEGLYSQGRVSSRHIIIDRTTLDLRLRDERSEEWSIGSCEKVSLAC